LGAAARSECGGIGRAGGECDIVEVFGESVAVFAVVCAFWVEWGGGEAGGFGGKYYMM